MPEVNGKSFPYTDKGKRAAEEKAKKTGQKVKNIKYKKKPTKIKQKKKTKKKK